MLSMGRLKDRTPNTWAFIGLIALLAIAPLPLASNRVWAASILAVALVGLLFLVLVTDFLRGVSHLAQLMRAALPIGLLTAFLGLLWLQALDFGPGSIAVDAHATTYHALLTAGYLSAFALVVMLCHSRARVRDLALALVACGVAQALIGIFLHSVQARYSLFFFDLDHGQHVLGTFSYRNSMANYMVLCISVGLGLVVGELFSQKPSENFSWRAFAQNAAAFLLSPAMLLRLMLAIMVIALVLTRSRGGNLGFVLALGLVLLPFLLAKGRLRIKGLLLVASIVVIDLLIIGKYIGVEKVVERINQTPIQAFRSDPGGAGASSQFSEESLQQRASPANASLAAWRERPLLGFGAGSFYSVFPAYAEAAHTGFYDHAHNDYIQILFETGVLGFLLLGALVMVSCWRAVRVAFRPRRSVYLGVSIGGLMAVLGVLTQALGDFHFQIPANALTFVVILGLIWSAKGFLSGRISYGEQNEN
jgi:O-antigen ligase